MSELQDDVEHELSVAALQLMAAPASGQLSSTIERACSQLRLLRQLSSASAMGDGERCRPDELYRAVAGWTETLGRAGFDVTFAIPATSDRLPGAIRLTLARTLDELGRLVLDRAEPGSPCTLTIRRHRSTDLELTAVVSAQRGRTAHRSPGLAALRHRVALVGGQFDLRTEHLDRPREDDGAGSLRCVVSLVLPHPPSAEL